MLQDQETEKNNLEEMSQQPEETTGEEIQNEVNNLKELLTQKENESREMLDRMQRLAAEFDNFRKRTQKEKDKLYIDAVSDIVARFLPVADNLERALKAAEKEEGQGLKEGVTLVFRQLSDIMEKLDVKQIEAVGQPFNPEIHNAVMHVEDDSLESGIVVEEFQKGYIYKDTVIRHSMVKVAN